MKADIISFVNKMKDKYGFEAIYIPQKDLYSLRYKGRGIQNFNSKSFYTLPKRHRENMLLPILKVGLRINSGEKALKDSIYQLRNIGKKI